jgi:hypothetical protein
VTLTERDIAALLTQDENPRLWLDAQTGANAYGVSPTWQKDLHEWGSATASGLSEQGWETARQGLGDVTPYSLGQELLMAYGLAPGICDVVLSSSGTAALALGMEGWDIDLDTVLICHPDDTGSQVHERLTGRGVQVTTVTSYDENGQRLSRMALNMAFSRAVEQVLANGRRVLLVMTDTTKLGRVVPGEAMVLACQQQDPRRVRVLVDACQGRLSGVRLHTYLERGWRVVLTGSKFIGGPPFSGVLLGYRGGLGQLMSAPCSLAPGACLRWRVALAELRSWQQADHRPLAGFLVEFQRRLFAQVAQETGLQLEPVFDLEHTSHPGTWDDHPTIFPFSLVLPDGTWLGRDALQRLFLRLAAPGDEWRVRWGQPVCLQRFPGRERWALRICLGVRQLLPWLASTERAAEALTASLDVCLTGLRATRDRALQLARSGLI